MYAFVADAIGQLVVQRAADIQLPLTGAEFAVGDGRGGVRVVEKRPLGDEIHVAADVAGRTVYDICGPFDDVEAFH